MKANQERVRELLTETVTLLCKNGLHFSTRLRIEGVIGITLDDDQVFIVHINESLDGEDAEIMNTGHSTTNISSIEESSHFNDSTNFDHANADCSTNVDRNSVEHCSTLYNKRLKAKSVVDIDLTRTSLVKGNHSKMEFGYSLEDSVNYDVPNAINQSTISDISKQLDENSDEEFSFTNRSNIKSENTAKQNASALSDCAEEFTFRIYPESEKFQKSSDASCLQHFQYKGPVTPNIEVQRSCGNIKMKNQNSVSLVRKRVYNSGINVGASSNVPRSRSGEYSLSSDIEYFYSLESTVASEILQSNDEVHDTSSPQLTTDLVSPSLKILRRRHSGFGHKAFACQEYGCRRTFFRSSELYRHQRINHGACYRQPRLAYSQLDCYIEEK